MAGDGTNDVGALKQAHVGVALLNGSKEDLDKIAKHFRETKMKEMYEKQVGMMQRFNQPVPPVPAQIAHLYPEGPANPHYAKAMEREAQAKAQIAAANAAKEDGEMNGNANGVPAKYTPPPQPVQQNNAPKSPQEQRKQQAQNSASNMAEKLSMSMLEEQMNEDEPPTIKLGDASVAAPFTSKLANVVAIPNIIRQGRCTLVATIQMYKILALNCLISAYSLSVLYLDGIKFGDGQVTISGMLMSVCFLSISRAKTVEQLSKERPQNNIWNWYIIPSVLGQFAVHIATLIYISEFVHKFEEKKDRSQIDLEGEFEPSLLNSAIYLLQLIQQISTFAINYQGRPFRESIRENKGMFYGIVLVTGVAFSCATEFVPEINEQLKLVPFTTEFKVKMCITMVVDYVGCWVIEKVLKMAFSDYKPKDIAARRPDQLEKEALRANEENEKRVKEIERKAGKAALRKDMDLGDDLSKTLSGLNVVDEAEASSSAGGSSKNAMDGEGHRVPDEGPKDLSGKASKDDSEFLDVIDFAMPFFDDYTWGSDTCNIYRCFGSVRFEDCYLEDVIIADCCMTNVIFRGCTITKATWAELHLADVIFEQCTFEDHLWRCRSLQDRCIKKGDFHVETSLGEEIPPETNMAVWVEQQQQAEIATSLGDEGYARLVQAELDGSEDFEPAAQHPAERDVSRGQASNAKSSSHERLQSKKVIQSRLFNDWNSPLWNSPGSNSTHHKVKSNMMTKDPAHKDVVAVPKRSVNISLANLGQKAPKPVNDADVPVHDEKVTVANSKSVFAASGAPGTPGTDSSVIAKRPTGVYGLPPHLRKQKA
ncbi:putative cation transporting ATPase [Hortaea werneckii]|nr:putative cation transporting ATPase [Hortaea werneckii]